MHVRSELQRYVELQSTLLSRLQAKLERRPLSTTFDILPRHGCLEVGCKTWQYNFHGGGVLFREEVSGRQVDVHDEIDHADLFDAWRLQIYFNSLGRTGTKILERALGTRGLAMEQAVEMVLRRLQDTGDIVAVDGKYRLAIDPS